MKAVQNFGMLSVRAALLAALAAGFMLPSAKAQSTKPNQKSDNQASASSPAQRSSEGGKAAETESAPAQKERAGGPQEGIKVHGHWVIDVRNPDGTLVTHREFENAYLPISRLLGEILARQNSVGFWETDLIGANSLYVLTEPGDTDSGGGNTFYLRTMTATTSGTTLVLSATFTAPETDTIVNVNTVGELCSANTAPATPCVGGARPSFTATALSPGVSFVSGQLVQVTVTISFS